MVKTFDALTAVDNVSFNVPRGQILGFLGPNGAGKSTTMKMLTCFIEPTSGTALVGGKDICREAIDVRRQIGYLPESAPSYGEMTVREFLEFIAEMRGFYRQNRITAAERVREMCFLKEVWHQSIETLSKGYRQRVGFAQSLLHDPPVLILDEPTDGLDPNQKHEVRQLIKSMAANKTIIFSTHILEEVEEVCERIIIIAKGKLVADDTPVHLMSQSESHNAVAMTFASPMGDSIIQDLNRLDGVARVEKASNGLSLRVFPHNGRTIVEPVASLARDRKWELRQLHVERGRLDEVFRRVTDVASRHASN